MQEHKVRLFNHPAKARGKHLHAPDLAVTGQQKHTPRTLVRGAYEARVPKMLRCGSSSGRELLPPLLSLLRAPCSMKLLSARAREAARASCVR